MCQGCEEQGKLLVAVAVAGVEGHLKRFVRHHGIVAIIKVARLALQLILLPLVRERLLAVGQPTALAIKGEVGGGGVAIK